jgi:hypothetical protein
MIRLTDTALAAIRADSEQGVAPGMGDVQLMIKQIEHLSLVNAGQFKAIDRIHCMYGKRLLELTGKAQTVLIPDEEFVKYFEEIKQLKAENKRLRADYAALSTFNPDWDKVAAAQDSVREHMALANALKAECEGLRVVMACVDDMAAIIRQLVHSLRKAAPGHALPEKALDYLVRKGLQGSPLRSGSESVEPALDTPELAELRADAGRYRWLIKNASVILDIKTAYQAETGFIKFDTMPGRTETELAIDAAMRDGERS